MVCHARTNQIHPYLYMYIYVSTVAEWFSIDHLIVSRCLVDAPFASGYPLDPPHVLLHSWTSSLVFFYTRICSRIFCLYATICCSVFLVLCEFGAVSSSIHPHGWWRTNKTTRSFMGFSVLPKDALTQSRQSRNLRPPIRGQLVYLRPIKPFNGL